MFSSSYEIYGKATAYRRGSIITAICTTIAVSSKNIDEAYQAENTCATNLLLVVVTDRGAAAAAPASFDSIERSGHGNSGHSKHGNGSGELHFYELMVVFGEVVE